MWRLRFCGAAFLVLAAGVQAQWQLPPGTTSSSNGNAQSSSASASHATLQEAEKLLEAQDWNGAVRLLHPLAESEPKNAHVQYDLGFGLDGAGDAAGAAKAYEAAAADDPGLMSARVSLGLLRARQGDIAGAGKWLREAVALPEDAASNPARAQAFRALARLDLANEPSKARDELIAAIRLNGSVPEDEELSGAIAEALHDDASAEAAYAKMLKVSPNDSDALAAYVRVLVRQGKQAEAEAALERGLTVHPDSTALLTERANLLLREKKFEAAIPLLERLRTGGDAASVHLLAKAYVAAGTPEKADPLLQTLIRGNPNDGTLLAEYGDSLIRQKRNGEAEQVLERALTLLFGSPEAKANAAAKLAFAASADHHPETVVRAVQLRDQSLPPDAPTTFLLAAAHDTLHHTAQAEEKYREFISLAGQAYPDEVWQSQQRLQVLRRAK